MDKRYGPRPPWHDAVLEIRGPAVADVLETFLQRWNDPTPLDHRNPIVGCCNGQQACRDEPSR